MGSSLNVSIGVAAYVDGYETERDLLYSLGLEEIEDWDTYEKNKILELLGLEDIPWCPGYSFGTSRDFSWAENRIIQNKNMEEWDRTEYDELHKKINEQFPNIETCYTGVSDYTTPIWVIKSTLINGYYEPITVSIEDVDTSELERYVEVMGLKDATIGAMAWASYY